MTGRTRYFERLTTEQRLFWLQMACASPGNARKSSIAIEAWHREHGMTHERATLELMAWLEIARESIGVEGAGHA